ncbi:redoxin domain-containing protein [Aquibacillus halophilus]|uniref:Redoxin domain-containing protein n=1 Tax=Aquibacillus halophilus TaxID=930132 RepID=A0A6A8DDM0_9BACI|nr:SCO family protein [Aquibacillus halophilus]MRH41871.1 redoxin domain-containing protein [Aquibacillus halophilus]
MKITFQLFFMSLVVVFLSACGSNYEGEFSFEVQEFEFMNQEGQMFSSNELEDKFWVANMIFTNCDTVCPPMTANMVRLQDKFQEEDLDVELVSFSVDPQNDTPEVLKQYSEERGADFDNWNLLTGYELQVIKEFAIKSFKAPVEKLDDSNQMLHTNRFYLVSPDGNAIKRYDGTKADEMDQIVEDIKQMR